MQGRSGRENGRKRPFLPSELIGQLTTNKLTVRRYLLTDLAHFRDARGGRSLSKIFVRHLEEDEHLYTPRNESLSRPEGLRTASAVPWLLVVLYFRPAVGARVRTTPPQLLDTQVEKSTKYYKALNTPVPLLAKDPGLLSASAPRDAESVRRGPTPTNIDELPNP